MSLAVSQLIGFGAKRGVVASSYRYLRLYITQGFTSNEVILAELELMVGGVDQIPTMSAATTSGVTMSASSQYDSSYAAWLAGDNTVTNNGWDSGVVSAPWWLKVDFGAGNAKSITSYSLQSKTTSAYQSYMPKSWNLQGSNDDSTWSDLNTQTAVSAWSQGEKRTYTI